MRIGSTGYELSTPVGDRDEIPMIHGGTYDVVALRERIEERRRLSDVAVRVVPEDHVRHEHLIATMDVVFGAGVHDVSVGTL